MEIGLPLCSEKIGKKSLMNPVKLVNSSKFFKSLRNCSNLKRLIFIYDPKVFEKFRRNKDNFIYKKGFGFSLLIEKSNLTTGILNPHGIGAPNHCSILEDFIAHGITKTVIVGRAGGVSTDLQIGDSIICTGAYKDEGTSFHYENSNRKSLPDYELLQDLIKAFPSCRSGDSWTTDAPYRETAEDVLFYRKKRVLTVEMEASAHFTVSRFRKIAAAAVFIISDIFHIDGDLNWGEDFSGKKVNKALLDGSEKVFRVLDSI
ncbi:hypothetical protein KAJ27_21370 [bacterium]|nr:hypothetical protein [bacterium]